MIWKLIRYSPAWRLLGWFSLFYIPAWLVLSQRGDNGIVSGVYDHNEIAPMILIIALRSAVAAAPEIAFRCTFFDAALPVDGRDLWVSKVIVLWGIVWIPVLAMSAVGFVLVHNPALPFLNGAAGLTAILLAAQSFRIREFHEPLLVRNILLFIGGTGMIVLAIALPQFAVRVLAGYLMANVAFFLLARSRVPKSFTVAPTAAKSSISFAWAAQGTSSPMRAWWKILRQIYLTYLLVPVGLGWLLGGASLVTMVFTVPILTATARTNWGFLAHLPVSPRKLFWAIWAPLPLAMFLGYEAALYFPMGPIHAVILGPRAHGNRLGHCTDPAAELDVLFPILDVAPNAPRTSGDKGRSHAGGYDSGLDRDPG